jgi:hypothetical protein
MQGRRPWNKGAKMSEEMREKARAAKLGRPLPKMVRRRMVKAHLGKTHSEARPCPITFHVLASCPPPESNSSPLSDVRLPLYMCNDVMSCSRMPSQAGKLCMQHARNPSVGVLRLTVAVPGA